MRLSSRRTYTEHRHRGRGGKCTIIALHDNMTVSCTPNDCMLICVSVEGTLFGGKILFLDMLLWGQFEVKHGLIALELKGGGS